MSPADRAQAEYRFRDALEASLGDGGLVWPVYQAYLRLLQTYADHQRPWPLSAEEQLLVDQWEAAELAATQAAFGTERYMGDAEFEISPWTSKKL
ncbi:MAG: hypothetical protein V4718_18520 [Pseudomonadota bacterium]